MESFETLLSASAEDHGHLCPGQVVGIRMAMLGFKNISLYAKVTNYAYKTMRRLLPGPYTFILEGSKLVPQMMLTKRKTAGIRDPAHNISQAITGALGNPIISTSMTLPNEDLLNGS